VPTPISGERNEVIPLVAEPMAATEAKSRAPVNATNDAVAVAVAIPCAVVEAAVAVVAAVREVVAARAAEVPAAPENP
jgi:hypothetical protein